MANPRLSREDRVRIGIRRIVANLDALVVANMRTLEMKISDSGPNDLRVDPHILTNSRQHLVKEKRVISQPPWFYRSHEPKERVAERLKIIKPLYDQTVHFSFTLRLGQALEISIFKALNKSNLMFVGGFVDLNEHDDSTIYSKEEPPLRFAGRSMPGNERFDFLVFHPEAGPLGIEAKNVREWVYPDREEVRELLGKAITSDTVPVLIARRIHFSSRILLETCGVMLFETYGQIYPGSDKDLADAVKNKNNLGYHDIKIGNDPNDLLQKFISTTLPQQAVEYRNRFDRFSDIISDFAAGNLSYPAFAAKVRRRRAGMPEDSDFSEEAHPNDWHESEF